MVIMVISRNILPYEVELNVSESGDSVNANHFLWNLASYLKINEWHCNLHLRATQILTIFINLKWLLNNLLQEKMHFFVLSRGFLCFMK